MNVRYSLGDYTLKVLGCDKSLDVLDFYYRNRNDFDIYESDKPEAFYTEEFIKNMLNAENKALMSLHFVRFFLVSNDNPDYIIGTISLSHINRGSSPSANMGYKIDRLNRGKGLASLMIAHMLDVVSTAQNVTFILTIRFHSTLWTKCHLLMKALHILM